MGHSAVGNLDELPKSKMGKHDGKFVLESAENVGPFMAAIGMPEDMIKKMMNSKNEITLTMVENADGSFTSSSEQSMCPELNQTTTFKLGETQKIEKPWPMTITITKSSDITWKSVSVMGEHTINNYGLTICGTLQGSALSFREEFRKVSPKISGFYKLESEKGMNDIMKLLLPQMDIADFEKMKGDIALRVGDKEDGLFLEEQWAGKKKAYTMKFDEEYDYTEPSFNVDEKRITTKVGPGCFKTISKSKKDGKSYEWTVSFNDNGFSNCVKAGGLEATECYRRLPDIDGTWRMAAVTGMENYLAACGVTGDQAKQLIADAGQEYFTIERLPGGKMRSQTNSKWLPAELVVKIGETYSFEMAGLGRSEGVMTELDDTILHVMKFGGKTMRITEKISGDFMVSEYVVDGSRSSTMKTILARD